MAKISVCIPTWECGGRGSQFLTDLLESAKTQTFTDFEVCVSDHSVDDHVEKLCDSYYNDLDIKYYRNTSQRGNGPANTNVAINMAKAEIVKIVFQDDFFCNNNALQEVANAFHGDGMWLVSGCNHTDEQRSAYYNQMYPQWNDNIIRGVNTISSPSVLSFRSSVKERFDENLVHMMDCEFYHRLYTKYGSPLIVNSAHVTNRVHSGQISSSDSNKDVNIHREVQYCLQKYDLR